MPVEETLLTWIGPPLTETFRRAFPGPGTTARAALDAYRAHYDAHGWRANRLIPGITDALARIRGRGIECHVATSKLGAIAERIIACFGLDTAIGRVFGSDRDGARSAKAELIAHALAELGIASDTAARAAMVGDRCHDVDGAHACGLPAIGVLWGFGSPGELAAAELRVADPGELASAVLATLGSCGRGL